MSTLRCFLWVCAAWTSLTPVLVQARAWPAPKFESAPCPTAVSASIDAAALSGVQCGHVEVPEHYFRARAKRLRVFVVIAKTEAQKPGTPVLFVAGGPGQALSAISGQVFGTGVMGRVRADRDIVLIDPRGAGFSEPRLRCPPPAPAQPATGPLSPLQQDAVHCAEALSAQDIDLSAYNTLNLARDLWSVRTALGLPKVILYAVSYGGFLGLQALRGAEHWVESAVLLSMPRPQGGSVLYSADTAQGALEAFNAQCLAQPACAAYGDFRSNLNELFGRLRAQPIELQLPSPDGQSSSA
ncbi:MAG TPA: alpha/beta fold hydrolase, partial [Polyangiaceae bacterium]|nr:alpha/beta fold hydrolase [Polyangiaceae bacterium]